MVEVQQRRRRACVARAGTRRVATRAGSASKGQLKPKKGRGTPKKGREQRMEDNSGRPY